MHIKILFSISDIQIVYSMNIDWANNESSFLIEITKQGFRTFLGKTFDIRIPLLKTLNQLPPRRSQRVTVALGPRSVDKRLARDAFGLLYLAPRPR